MLQRSSLLILVLIGVSTLTSAQTVDETLEWLADQNPEEIAQLDQIANDLIYFADHPIDLNSADFYQLRQLHLLSDYQIAAIIHYKDEHGDLLSIYELGYIERLGIETIRHLLPYVTVVHMDTEQDTTLSQVLDNTHHEFIGRWSRQLRSPGPENVGSPNKTYLRYTMHYRDKFRGGYTVEKDAGEKNFDFQSFHAAWYGKRWQFLIGDYHLDLGQGLVASTAFRMSGISSGNRTISFGTKPYTSVGEINYFRGVSVRHRHNKWSFLAFGSHRKIDATLDTLSDEIVISSDNATGLHRTPKELSRRKVVGLSHAGFDIERKTSNWKLNVHGIHGRYALPLRLNDEEYEQYRFTGTDYSNLGVSHYYQRNHKIISGEVAIDQKGIPAFVENIGFQPDPYVRILFRLWHLPYRFHTPLGVNPDGGSNAQNSTGTSLTLHGKLFPKWSYAGYLERTKSPWLKYRVDGPSTDQTEQVYLHWTPDRDLRGYLMFRHRVKTLNDGIKEGVNDLKRVNSYNFRIHVDRDASEEISVNCRFAVSRVKQDSIWTTGWLCYLGASYRTSDRKWDLKGRFALFDTETFESRIYAYEQNARGMFSVPMFNGSGSRFYLMVRYKASSQLSFWFRFDQWIYTWDGQTPYPPGRDSGVFGQFVYRL